MHAKYKYDPEIVELHENDIARFLRREMKQPNVVVYRSRMNGAWVVSLKDGSDMVDIGFLGDGSGDSEEQCWLSKKQGDYLIDRMTNLITVAEARKRLRKATREKWENVNELDEELKDCIKATVRAVYNRYGELAAERVKIAAKQDPVTHIAAADL